MDKRIEENIRVKEAITFAFFSLLKEKDIDNITVTDITKRAKVSRMAYYRNFDSKSDIIKYFFDSRYDELMDSLDEGFDFWSFEYGLEYLKLFYKYRDIIVLLYDRGYSGFMLNVFNDANEILAGDMPSNSIERYNLYFAAGASFNGLIKWIKGGCKESIEEINRSIASFLGIVNEGRC